jgi:hypothetical protein
VQSEANENNNIAPEETSDPTMTIQDELKIIMDNYTSGGKSRKTPVAYLKFCKVRNLFFP